MAGVTDLIGSAADWLSLVLVFASFLVMAFLTYRVKTIRSFQFEMFVVLLVITLSEVPKLLNDIGIINISDIETTGLEIHTVAMVFLAVFVSLRATKYLKKE
ncbi:MAG: hypothetical protein OK456_02160 [Thaumarchaeota archaeon]|nr:hypothetical protein [Nitrososphaerota archaeon]